MLLGASTMFHSPIYIWLQVLQGLAGTASEHGSSKTALTMKMENWSQTTPFFFAA